MAGKPRMKLLDQIFDEAHIKNHRNVEELVQNIED